MSAKSTRSVRPASSSTRPMSTRAAVVPLTCLVTGGSGYIALHVIDLLLKEGHKVRTTVRSLENEEKCGPIKALAKNPEQLTLVEADLHNAECWKETVKDIDIVFHVASPFPLMPAADTHEELIKTAVDGTNNVLKACLDTKVKRVVLTSSCVAIFGDSVDTKCLTEADWGDAEKSEGYTKSKILAEKAAWDLLEERKKNNESVFELAVINPSLVMGPVLSKAPGTSAAIFSMAFANKSDKPISNMYMPMCDVRDVALAHIRAATLPEAVGQRHIILSQKEWVPIVELHNILSKEFNPKGMNIATEPVEEGEGRGKGCSLDNTRMIEVLKCPPTDLSKTIIDMANSFLELGDRKSVV